MLMHYRCADRKSCVAMAASNTHEKIIAPYTISILLTTPLVKCLDCLCPLVSELHRHYANVYLLLIVLPLCIPYSDKKVRSTHGDCRKDLGKVTEFAAFESPKKIVLQ